MRERMGGKVLLLFYNIIIMKDGGEGGKRTKKTMRKKPCDYYSRSIIEDAEADERIKPMETEAEVMVKNL